MSEMKVGQGIVRKVGWMAPTEGGDHLVFQAVIEFPKGPPDLPSDVVWKRRLVIVSLAEDGSQ